MSISFRQLNGEESALVKSGGLGWRCGATMPAIRGPASERARSLGMKLEHYGVGEARSGPPSDKSRGNLNTSVSLEAACKQDGSFNLRVAHDTTVSSAQTFYSYLPVFLAFALVLPLPWL